jgi:hypothetical protein
MAESSAGDQAALPGADIVAEGLADLAAGRESVASLLVSVGAPRLQRSGIAISQPFASPESRLYAMLYREYGDGAHSRYNALIRRLVSFERSLESAK